jgi:phytoene dehydrogenase-like protein
MFSKDRYDAVVVGAGPNGLSAGIKLAREGWSVLILEAEDTVGGGVRSAALTLPGFIHDVCSAIFPLSMASPFLRSLPLEDHGLEWIHPLAPVAHPLDGGRAVIFERSLDETAQSLGVDERNYRRLIEPFLENWQRLVEEVLGPLPLPPKRPLLMARFGIGALRSAVGLARSRFEGEPSRAALAGNAAHSILPLEAPGTAAAGILMSVFAHTVGWPMVRGGAQQLANALLSYFCSLGGEVITNFRVTSLDQLPRARAVLLDLTPRQFLQVAGTRLPQSYRRRLERFRYGPGVFKIDYALDGPVPWSAPECARAATVHLGGTIEEIAFAERAVWNGEHPQHPFVLFVQQSLFDPSRAPAGKHTAWAYCHVPHGSTLDMTRQVEGQIERFAPGFRDLVLARHTHNTQQMQAYNPNYVGGDIIGGVQDLRQLYFRPVASLNPYATPLQGVYLSSSSTPPGGGVHAMSGYHAAQAVLRANLTQG